MWWVVELPAAEARHLPRITLEDASGSPLPGLIRAGGDGRVMLDDAALSALELMGGAPGFAVAWVGEMPVLRAGRDEYLIKPEGAPLTGI